MLNFANCAAASLCREDVALSSAGLAGLRVGYCPQQDALDPFLTGWEHLRYYCSLRGTPKACIPQVRPHFSRKSPLPPGIPTQPSQPTRRNQCLINAPGRCAHCGDHTEMRFCRSHTVYLEQVCVRTTWHGGRGAARVPLCILPTRSLRCLSQHWTDALYSGTDSIDSYPQGGQRRVRLVRALERGWKGWLPS